METHSLTSLPSSTKSFSTSSDPSPVFDFIANICLIHQSDSGCEPTVVTYGSVIDGLAKIDRLDEAYMLFEEAKSKRIALNVVIYSSLIDGFGKVGRIDEAYLILEELMQKGLTPNVYTWNSLLDALVKAEEINEALVCFQSMKELKCTPWGNGCGRYY